MNGKMIWLNYLISDNLFDSNVVRDKDEDGLYPLDYACFGDNKKAKDKLEILPYYESLQKYGLRWQ